MQFKLIFPLITALSVTLLSSCGNSTISNPFNKIFAKKEKTQLKEVIATADADGYFLGKPVINPETGQPVKDLYTSPFKPYNQINTKGFKSGQLVGDSSTIQLNPTTGKPDKSTMKVFRLP